MEKLRFGFQMFVSSVVIGLCSYKLADDNASQADKSIYWAGLTAVTSYWMPAPKFREVETQKPRAYIDEGEQ